MTYSSLLSPANGSGEQTGLLEAEELVRSVLDSLSAHIAILNDRGVIIHVNRAWCRFAEDNHFKSSSYGVGMNYLSVCNSATSPDGDKMARGIRSVIDGQTPEFYLEYPCHGPNERRWFVARVSRFVWRNFTRVIVSHQNVTEIKRAQVALADSKQRLEAILDNLVDGIVTFDARGKIESLNRAGMVIFDYQAHEIIGQNIRLLVPALEEYPGTEGLSRFIAQLTDLGDEITGRRKDGRIFPMYFAVSQIRLDNNKRLYSGIIQDFTERKYLESQLLEKERLNIALEKERELRDLKNRFISMMSHELRTPLGAIQLANSMLRTYGDRLSEQEKRESYDAIDAQVAHLTELIQDVMTISRTDFTGAEFHPERADLETCCRDIIEEIQVAYRMQCCISFEGTERRVEADIDRKLLRRALSNLLINAIKYSPPGAPVTVTLTLEDGQGIIRVRDEGIGIPPEDMPRLFEPFHRAANVGTIQGTGLGLAITRQAIELHGGSITAESTVGVGTTFIVRLPLAV